MIPRTGSRSHTSTRALASVAVALSLIGAACGDGSEASSDDTSPDDDVTDDSGVEAAATVPDAEVSEPTEEATTTSSTTTSSTTTTTIPLRGADPSDPAPVGDPEFDLPGGGDGDVIGASMLGLVELPVDADETEAGSCVAILNIVTVEAAEALTASSSSTARPTLYAGDDEQIFADFGSCDDSALDAAGYINNGIEALPGTQYGVATPFFLEEGITPAAMSLRVSGSDERFYDITPIDEIPTLDDLAVGEPPTDLASPSENAADSQRFDGGILDSVSTFDVSVFGYAASERREGGLNDDEPGRCVTTIGTLKGVDAPGAIINAFGITDVQILAGGRIWERSDGIGACDEETLEASGYFTDFGAGVAPGNTFAVQTPFLIPEGLEPDAILLGDPSTPNGYIAYEAALLTDIPAAPEREMINPDVDLVAVGDASTFDIEQFDSVWTGTVAGMFPLTSNAVEEFTCFAVLGEMARQGDDQFAPDVGIIADGGYFGDGVTIGVQCDESALEAAGYTPLRDVGSLETVTDPTRFYTVIFVRADADLGAIAIGNAASPDNVQYVEPTIIDAIPA